MNKLVTLVTVLSLGVCSPAFADGFFQPTTTITHTQSSDSMSSGGSSGGGAGGVLGIALVGLAIWALSGAKGEPAVPRYRQKTVDYGNKSPNCVNWDIPIGNGQTTSRRVQCF